MKKKLMLTLAALFLVLLTGTTVFAASTKALRGKITLEKTPNKSYENTWVDYNFGVCLKNTTKLTKKMKLEATLYIEKKLLADGNTLGLGWWVDVHSKKKNGEFDHIGTIEAPDYFIITNDGGKLIVTRTHQYSQEYWKTAPAGKLLKVSETSKYYILKLNKVSLNTVMSEWDEEGNYHPKKFDSKKYALAPCISLHVGDDGYTVKKKVSGYIFLDDVAVYGGSTVKADFEKANSWNWEWLNLNKDNYEKELKPKVVTLKY